MLKIYQLRKRQNTFAVTLKYKGVGVAVEFTDGNTYNGTPAKCYTRDPFKQKAIEASQMFKDKEIVLERAVAEASDNKPAPKRAGLASRIVPMKKVTVSGGENAGNDGKNAADVHEDPKTEEPGGEAPGTGNDGKNADEVHEEAAEVHDETAEVHDGTAEVQGAGATKMTFDNVGEAILYVAQNFGVETRTEKEARDILKEHGINPTIKRG